MPASVSVKQRTGASGTPTDTSITNLRMTLADVANNGASNPLAAPAAGSIQSFWSSLFLNADTSPAGTINNIKWYTTGSNPWTGVTLQVATAGAYTQATGTASSGTVLSAPNYPGLVASPVDGFTKTSTTPLSVNGTITNPSTGKISDFVIKQLTVVSTAIQGTLAASTGTFQYDEN